jgi:putative ABC transport system permease protein
VAVVNRTFAHRILGDSGAVGRVIRMGDGGMRRVVGVVGDVKSFIGAPAMPSVFITSAQTPAGLTRGFASWFPIHVVARTVMDPGALRDALTRTIHETDPTVPIGRVRTMDEVLASSLALQRFIMLLLSVFAALAIMLAAVGIYGVMAYFAAQRMHEIGVRMALGALPRDVLGLVLRRGMGLVLLGGGIGLSASVTLTRLLAGTLYGVSATDPLTFAAVTALLAGVALAACYVPARRAARGDPMEALRYE